MYKYRPIEKYIFFVLLTLIFLQYPLNAQTWSESQILDNHPGITEYPRMLKLANGDWLAVNTFDESSSFGLDLRIWKSTDNCRTWTWIDTISEPGRDVDNGQLLQLKDGSVLLSCRSVIWGASFKLNVYKSDDFGNSFNYISTIDQNEGSNIGGKGVYEPHLGFLDDGRVSVMYANEKYEDSNPRYDQVLSQKISSNGGVSWGNEIFVAWDTQDPDNRPGMPVWTKMSDGRYAVVFEVCGTLGCDIYFKTSNNGINWEPGIGVRIPDQSGAPYLLSINSGRLYVTSNNGKIKYSDNYGATWKNAGTPWPGLSWPNLRWSSLYEVKHDEIAALTSLNLPSGNGIDVYMSFGKVTGGPGSSKVISGGIYRLIHKGTNQCLEVANGSFSDGANVIQNSKRNAEEQLWQIKVQSDGYYTLENVRTKQLLNINGNAVAGSNVQQNINQNNKMKRWSILPIDETHFKLMYKDSNKCLDVAGGSTTPQTNVMLWDDIGGNAQRWVLEIAEVPIVSGGVYKLWHKGTNQVLDVAGGGSIPGTNIAQYYDIGGSAQEWLVSREEEGTYKLTHNGTNQVLDVAGGSSIPGTNVSQYNDIGGNAQRWKIEYTGDGYFKLTHKGTNQCLDVDSNSNQPGANVHQWTDNGSDAQRWKFDLLPNAIGNVFSKKELRITESNAIKVYPNPIRDNLNVASELSIKSIIILTMQGVEVMNKKNNAKINVETLSTGYYILKIIHKEGIYTTTFIKE